MQWGIRRKIFFGFIFVCFILFLSGLVVIFEMSRLRRSVSGILSQKVETVVALHNVEATILEEVSVLLYSLHEDTSLSEVIDNIAQLEQYMQVIRRNSAPENDTLLINLERLLADFEGKLKEQPYLWGDDYTIRRGWYAENLYPVFFSIRQEVDRLIARNNVDIEATSYEIEDGFYRANIPAIIAVVIGIVVVLLFYYFVNLYFISPLLRIKKGVRSYLNNQVRYAVDVNSNDELHDLNEAVKELTGEHRTATKQ